MFHSFTSSLVFDVNLFILGTSMDVWWDPFIVVFNICLMINDANMFIGHFNVLFHEVLFHVASLFLKLVDYVVLTDL